MITTSSAADVVAVISRAEQADYGRFLGAREIFVTDDIAKGALSAQQLDYILDAVAGAALALW